MKFLITIAFTLIYWNTIAQLSTRPNIILIVADDLGYGDLGCFGQQKIETPNLDLLAKNGLKFTQFYAGTTVCAPSRASLMTGLHTGHTPVRGNKGFEPEGQTPLPDSVITFANRLQDAGYTTAAFGKWGLGYITTPGDPNKKGFDRFYGYNCQSLAHNYYPAYLWNNHERVDLPGNLKYDSVYSADLIQKQVLVFLKQQTSNPFFLFLPYTLPHGDVIVPHDSVYNYYIKKFKEKPLNERPSSYSNLKRSFEPYPHAAFASMVSRLDMYVGEIISMLKEKAQLENTLILFTSDNGPHRENGGDPVFFNSNGGFRGIKRDLYEGGIRVPFIAYWKGKVKAGTSKLSAAGWDLFPTLLDLAGLDNPRQIDGISILPTLLSKGKQEVHEFLYWEFHEQGGKQAVRWKNWKGVALDVSNEKHPRFELYDLAKDPGEKNDVAQNNPSIVSKLQFFIIQAHLPDKDWPLLLAEKSIAK